MTYLGLQVPQKVFGALGYADMMSTPGQPPQPIGKDDSPKQVVSIGWSSCSHGSRASHVRTKTTRGSAIDMAKGKRTHLGNDLTTLKQPEHT